MDVEAMKFDARVRGDAHSNQHNEGILHGFHQLLAHTVRLIRIAPSFGTVAGKTAQRRQDLLHAKRAREGVEQRSPAP